MIPSADFLVTFLNEATRRVRSWEALNRPGCCSSNHSIIVVAFSLPLRSSRSRGSISSSHTPSKGSGRVRHQRSSFVSDGNRPSCHLRADRTHIPAIAAAVSWVFPSISFCLSSLTCRSLIKIRHLRAGRFTPSQPARIVSARGIPYCRLSPAQAHWPEAGRPSSDAQRHHLPAAQRVPVEPLAQGIGG